MADAYLWCGAIFMDLPGHRTIDVLHYIEELFPVNDIANYIYGRNSSSVRPSDHDRRHKVLWLEIEWMLLGK